MSIKVVLRVVALVIAFSFTMGATPVFATNNVKFDNGQPGVMSVYSHTVGMSRVSFGQGTLHVNAIIPIISTSTTTWAVTETWSGRADWISVRVIAFDSNNREYNRHEPRVQFNSSRISTNAIRAPLNARSEGFHQIHFNGQTQVANTRTSW